MKTLLVALTLTAIALLTGCSPRGVQGNGNITSEKRTIASFTTLDAEGAFDIQWTNGAPALSITTDQNLFARIKTDVSGTTLRIYSDERINPTKGIKVILSSGALKDAGLTGAIHLTANQVMGKTFKLSSSGAVTIEASGKVDALTAKLTGASRLNAGNLNAGDASVTLIGASSADVTVTGKLKASIVGAGTLTYSGTPSSIEKSITGAGTIHQRK